MNDLPDLLEERAGCRNAVGEFHTCGESTGHSDLFKGEKAISGQRALIIVARRGAAVTVVGAILVSSVVSSRIPRRRTEAEWLTTSSEVPPSQFTI